METIFLANKAIVTAYSFSIPDSYSPKVPKNISTKFHEGCEIIRRGRIKEGLDILMKEGAKYQPLTAYVLAQLSAYFEKDWNRVMNLLVYAISNDAYYNLVKSYWVSEWCFDYTLVNMAALKTGRNDEAERLLKVIDSIGNVGIIKKENGFYKEKLMQPQEYLAQYFTPEPDKLLIMFERSLTKDYEKQHYYRMAYGFVKLNDLEKAAYCTTGWSEYLTGFSSSKSAIVVPIEALTMHEYYGIGDNEFMEKQWCIQQKCRYVRLPEDGPADTRLPKSKPCNNLKSLKVSGLLEAAFGDKLCVQDGWVFEKLLLGEIEIPTGKIIAVDPFFAQDEGFITDFPKGTFPVEIAVAKKFTDQRVGLARVKFSDNEIKNWDIALTSDIKPKKDELYGYAVDAGTGCFADVENYKAYEKQWNDEVNDYIIEEFNRNGNTGLIYKNVAMFSTGFGDGFYQSYIGRDADGNIVSLITDFQITNP